MSRLLLLAILVLWMCPRENAYIPDWPLSLRISLFVGVYAVLVIFMATWSRLLARRVADDRLDRLLDRYNLATEIARYFVPTWFAVGLFALGWGHFIHDLLLPTVPAAIRSAEMSRLAEITRQAELGIHSQLTIPTETYWRIPGLLLRAYPPSWLGWGFGGPSTPPTAPSKNRTSSTKPTKDCPFTPRPLSAPLC